MRVAADYDLKTGGWRIEVEMVHVMQDVNMDTPYLYNFGFW
jgi:hypothetical protein